jgi:hypothetical protein
MVGRKPEAVTTPVTAGHDFGQLNLAHPSKDNRHIRKYTAPKLDRKIKRGGIASNYDVHLHACVSVTERLGKTLTIRGLFDLGVIQICVIKSNLLRETRSYRRLDHAHRLIAVLNCAKQEQDVLPALCHNASVEEKAE